MGYSETVLQRASARLAEEKQLHETQNRNRIRTIYEKQPRLAEIDRTLRATSAKIMAACFKNSESPEEAMQKLREENLSLQEERAWILESNDIDPEDLVDTPICAACGGTGYVGAVMCDCLRELCRQEQKKELSSLFGSGRESFERFRLDLYPDTVDPQLGISARTLMQYVFSNAQHYAKTFGEKSGSILMLGATGLGKTYLSACIAKTVSDRGYSVVYETAGKVFSDFETEKFKFHGENTDLTHKYVSCNLLILDDLGTEMTTQFTVAALYQIVNQRMLANRATIISSNLAAGDLERRYSAQIASRLLGTYELYQFRGRDIRMMEK